MLEHKNKTIFERDWVYQTEIGHCLDIKTQEMGRMLMFKKMRIGKIPSDEMLSKNFAKMHTEEINGKELEVVLWSKEIMLKFIHEQNLSEPEAYFNYVLNAGYLNSIHNNELSYKTIYQACERVPLFLEKLVLHCQTQYGSVEQKSKETLLNIEKEILTSNSTSLSKKSIKIL